jgi:hypothetical protein
MLVDALTFELCDFMQGSLWSVNIERYADARIVIKRGVQWFSEVVAAQPARALTSLLQIPRLDAK